MSTAAFVIIGILIIIVVIIVLIFLFYRPTTTLGGTCGSFTTCTGSTCDGGICRVPIGGRCDNVTQCVSNARSCTNGICSTSSPTSLTSTQNAPPNSLLIPTTSETINNAGIADPYNCGICLSNANCQEGFMCARATLVDAEGIPLVENLPANVIDAAQYGQSILILLSDFRIGILASKNGAMFNCLIIKENQRSIQRIFFFGGIIYGISNGLLYRVTCDSIDTDEWLWEAVSWAPVNVIDIGGTTNGHFLWLQTSSEGILYQGYGNVPTEYSRVQFPSDRHRVYGYDNQWYLNIDSANAIARLFPDNTLISNIVDGVILSDGKVVKIRTDERCKYSTIRQFFWRVFYITVPKCIPL